jgi:nicotinamidase-related amidase
MALTALDPVTALIVVDLQKGIAGMVSGPAFVSVVTHSAALADAFRARALPVVLVSVVGGAPGRTEQPPRNLADLPADFAELMPGLGRHADDILVVKRSWGAFATADLEARLKALGVTQVVVAGVATGTGVEATARQAYEAGFNVTLATDAMTDARAEAHAYSITNVFPRLGETGTTAEILALLEGRAQ